MGFEISPTFIESSLKNIIGSNSSTVNNENKFNQSIENIPVTSNYLKVHDIKNSKSETLKSDKINSFIC